MDGAEDVGDEFAIAGPLFELGEAELHALQSFLALCDKLLRQVIHLSLIGSGGRQREAKRLNFRGVQGWEAGKGLLRLLSSAAAINLTGL